MIKLYKLLILNTFNIDLDLTFMQCYGIIMVQREKKKFRKEKMYDPKIFTKEELDRFSEEDLTNLYDFIIEQGLKRKDNSKDNS